MRLDLGNLPSNVGLLDRLVCDMAVVVETRDDEIGRLQRLIKELQRARFGRRSERLDPDQLALGFEDLDADVARTDAHQAVPSVSDPEPDSRAASRHPTLPAHLPRQDVMLDMVGDGCPDCGGRLHPIGEATSEMLDWVPARLRVLRIRRPKYGCRACGTIHPAPAPERPIAKGLASPGLLAQVLVSKYCDHAPLYRQAQIFARQGVDLKRATLANWVGGACWWLEPLRKRLADHVFASTKLFADDTSIPAAGPGPGGSGSMRAMTALGLDRIRRRPSSSTVPTARRSDPPPTSRASAACCRSMAMPGSNG
jgi:transposase